VPSINQQATTFKQQTQSFRSPLTYISVGGSAKTATLQAEHPLLFKVLRVKTNILKKIRVSFRQ
jgi:hypothetical protein